MAIILNYGICVMLNIVILVELWCKYYNADNCFASSVYISVPVCVLHGFAASYGSKQTASALARAVVADILCA